MALVWVRAKIEYNTLFGKGFGSFLSNALVRVRAKIEKTLFLVMLWQRFGLK